MSNATADAITQDRINYEPLPTLKLFHEDSSVIRCIVGPVGSGKTTAAALEVGIFLPQHLLQEYGIKKTRWVVVRNTYVELRDTTLRTVREWFPEAFNSKDWSESQMILIIKGEGGYEAEILFRSCDRPEHIKKLKSLEITGYWIDESIEVPREIKLMLKNRIGRYPKKCPEKYGLETTNPPDVEHETYTEFAWHSPPPGPLPAKDPLPGHRGYWQPPRENDKNLPPGYYESLRLIYRDNPDWVDMYIDGKPGVIIVGRLVYNNFRRAYHVAKDPIPWMGGELIMGWDNSGNCPACVVAQIPGPRQIHILREYYSDKMGIVDFTSYVVQQLNQAFPGQKDVDHWGDPAANQKYPKKEGGFTSNADLMADCGVDVAPSEQNFQARIESVDQQLGRIDGVLIDPSCTRLINGFLGGYCYPPNKSLQGEYLPNVLKNKYSHVHDALQYLMVRVFKPDLRPDARDPVLNLPYRDHYNPLEGTGYDPFTWRPGGGR
jgi:hypothetical protein